MLFDELINRMGRVSRGGREYFSYHQCCFSFVEFLSLFVAYAVTLRLWCYSCVLRLCDVSSSSSFVHVRFSLCLCFNCWCCCCCFCFCYVRVPNRIRPLLFVVCILFYVGLAKVEHCCTTIQVKSTPVGILIIL